MTPQKDFQRVLSDRLASTLPSGTAHKKMSASPYFIPNQSAPEGAGRAAVLILIYPMEDILHTVFMRRTHHPEDKHSGQISFPGGKFEQQDKSLQNTALREFYEEMGVDVADFELLGALSPIYIPVSRFEIHPFVAWTDDCPNFCLDSSEVQYIIPTPIRALFDKNTSKKAAFDFLTDFHYPTVPYFDINGHCVWGATAMITQEFIDTFVDFKKYF